MSECAVPFVDETLVMVFGMTFHKTKKLWLTSVNIFFTLENNIKVLRNFL